MSNRNDDPAGVMQYAGRYAGGKALIVLGGTSAKEWKKLCDEIKPSVILGANGVNAMIADLHFWLCIENMRRTFKLAVRKDMRALKLIAMLRRTGAKVRLTNWKNIPFIPDKKKLIAVQRCGAFDLSDFPADFSFRKYGNGFLKGGLMRNKSAIGDLKLPIGTVALQAIHLAGILGVAEIHTVGLDLCFKGKDHHAYPYPEYAENRYFLKDNFLTYKGFQTMAFWVESSEYLLGIIPRLKKEGIEWTDHSDGLLQR